jgi:cold shock CspA family protein
METPVQIDFQGMNAREGVRGSIDAHIGVLEERFGRITACRVVLKAPSGHHQTGGQYEVNIRLTLPSGREVNVSRTAKADERHADLTFAINDAFHRARRRLQDQVRRMQGATKTHLEAALATVARVEPDDGFGFLQTSDGREIYFHKNSLLNGSFATLKVGTRVTYSEDIGEKGPKASTVKILGRHGMR